ncbi:ATP-grasp domain-containing protein [Erwinia psidii]|uniref:Serine kinase n=1 Tax=Erwinia psidii TaxID=69224 RepID=A0A3N6SGB2_9GAMM|nr:serine kinase [Erwinia psidii]MCX8958742.1 serine kinase [Erwinia psidii]MCX8963022.1 serine kinase [Erwinia psidii]MCX8967362.1 serine kinase [Erwinia psidii]RQM36596.1 serine kinase [Erwinia psidii]
MYKATETILIISSELDVGHTVKNIMASYPDTNRKYIYLLEDLKDQAGDELRFEGVFIIRNFAVHSEVEAVFRQIAATYSVTRVLTDDEFSVCIAAWANDFWQLPGLSFDMATRFRDKKRMKHIARQAGINTAREIAAEEIRRGEVSFPVILKPRSLAGSVGVKIISDASQLNDIDIAEEAEYCDMDETQYFIESYNPQPIYQLDAVLLQGRLAYLFAGEYIGKPIDYLEECALGYLSVTESDLRDVWWPFAEKVLSAFDGPDGVYHIEAFGDAGEGVELLEIAYRPGGGVTVEMIQFACGLDLRFTHLVAQLGVEVDRNAGPEGKAWGYMMFPKKHLAKEPLYVSQVSLPFAGSLSTLKMQILPNTGDIASGGFFCHKDGLGSFVFCGSRDSVARDLKCIVADYRVSLSPQQKTLQMSGLQAM